MVAPAHRDRRGHRDLPRGVDAVRAGHRGIGVATGEVDLGTTPQQANDALYKLIEIDAASPLSLILALGSVALLLPSAIIGQLAAGLRPLGVRHSVAFRIRWRWFFVSLVPAFVTVAAAFLIPIGFSLATGDVPFGPMTTDPALFAICLAIILVITPLQSAAEEYVFRGLLAQSIGAWVRFAPVGWIITTIVFVSGHVYDVWGLLSVGAFGFGAAVIVSRTGGLEAGIALALGQQHREFHRARVRDPGHHGQPDDRQHRPRRQPGQHRDRPAHHGGLGVLGRPLGEAPQARDPRGNAAARRSAGFSRFPLPRHPPPPDFRDACPCPGSSD